MNQNGSQPEIGGRYAKFALGLLVVVYVFNFIDRQILSVLAEDIKADLGLSDSDLGFLFGTAFAVFYSIFGIPLGKLADVWSRKKLISLGLATWSMMTALSGTAQSFTALATYRFGVGIGESSASPATFSLLSDYFSPKVRATVLAIYSSGVYIGAGIGIFLGGWIVSLWNSSFPDPLLAPFGLRGWQAAFIGVGVPGLLIAILTWQIREPKRGMSEGIDSEEDTQPLKTTLKEFMGLTPLVFIQTKDKKRFLLTNCYFAFTYFLVFYLLILITGDYIQWIAFGIGLYLMTCWIQGLKFRDPVAHGMIFKSKALIFALLGFPFIAFNTYAHGAFGPAFYMRTHGLDEAVVGTVLGLIVAVGGVIGVIAGGITGDRLRRRNPNGRLWVAFFAALFVIPTSLGLLYSPNLYMSLFWNFLFHIVSPMWVGLAATTVSDLVLPRMRAIAGAFYLLVLSMIGLALGPYTVGKISDIFQLQGHTEGDALRLAFTVALFFLAIPLITFVLACRYLPGDESSKIDRARELGEII